MILCTCISCDWQKQQLEEKNELLAIGMEKKKEAYIRLRHLQCKNNIYIEAERLVDSTLRVKYRHVQLDTFIKPPIPAKPTKPPTRMGLNEDSIEPLIFIEEDTSQY